MNNEIKYFTKGQAIEESTSLEFSKVALQRTWVFWENYEPKPGIVVDWKDLLKELIKIDNIIQFWQFWNNYPGNKLNDLFFNGERYR
jgi:hypothetical protein